MFLILVDGGFMEKFKWMFLLMLLLASPAIGCGDGSGPAKEIADQDEMAAYVSEHEADLVPMGEGSTDFEPE